MASKRSSQKKTTEISRGTETGAPVERAPIPDPLGDDRRVGASGQLTSGEPGHAGLMRSGSTPLPDGGVKQHTPSSMNCIDAVFFNRDRIGLAA